jgi:hypothetical protein
MRDFTKDDKIFSKQEINKNMIAFYDSNNAKTSQKKSKINTEFEITARSIQLISKWYEVELIGIKKYRTKIKI